jgi:xanthine permease XanP
LGVPGISASPSLVSVAKTTDASSRVIALSIAGWLVVLCCLPKFAGLIVNMPRPVMAAALFFNGAMMFVAGIQIVTSRPITLRDTLVIGFSILAAITVAILPDFYRSLPGWTRQFTSSIISMAVTVSVPLTGIFFWQPHGVTANCGSGRILRWLQRELSTSSSRSRRGNGRSQCKTPNGCAPWSIQLSNTLWPMPTGRWTSASAGDSFDVLVTLRYTGNLPALPDAHPKKELVEEQRFVSGLTGYLSGLHADRIERTANAEDCEIRLPFRL